MKLPDTTVAVVTGAGQGNGAAIARGLAEAGARVALADINPATVRAVADEIVAKGGIALAEEVNVADAEAVTGFADHVAAAFGPCSVLVNNAGIIRRLPIDDPGYELAWDAIFSVNAEGSRNMLRAFLGQLTRTRGSLINLGSVMSLTGGAGLSAYAASKGAVAQFTKALAHDLSPRGVRVNAILPGVIETPMTETTRADQQAIARFMAHTPMGRVGRPEELVGPVLFLASEAASYVTGALLPVDGGYLAA